MTRKHRHDFAIANMLYTSHSMVQNRVDQSRDMLDNAKAATSYVVDSVQGLTTEQYYTSLRRGDLLATAQKCIANIEAAAQELAELAVQFDNLADDDTVMGSMDEYELLKNHSVA